jgi:hypothetical protein
MCTSTYSFGFAAVRFVVMALKTLPIVMAATAISMLINQQPHAAEISCAQPWGAKANDRYISNWFPSGRRPSVSTCRALLIRGNIEAGDYQRFVYFLSQNHPFIDAVVLASPGGLGEEALKIGRIIRRYFLNTFAPARWIPAGTGSYVDGYGMLFLPYLSGATLPEMLAGAICQGPACHCASACFLVWAAGDVRYGSAVGIHRPTIQSTTFANLPPERASKLYRGLLSDIAAYLLAMEVPQRYADMMSDTASSDIKWLSGDDALAIGRPPSIAEWVAATCGAYTDQDLQQHSDLERRGDKQAATGQLLPNGKLLSDKDQALLDANLAKAERIHECGEEKKANFRDTMAPAQAASNEQRTVQNTSPACEPSVLASAIGGARTGNTKLVLQAVRMCPMEICPAYGLPWATRAMSTGNSSMIEWGLAVRNVCNARAQ